jgi:sphingosine kinase
LESFEDCLKITTHKKEFQFKVSSSSELTSLNKIINKELAFSYPKHLLVFVNPISGVKKSMETFEIFSKLFNKVGIKLTTIFTKKRYEAQEITKDLDLTQYTGIVCISGDGTLNEVVNGLMSRKDWESAIKIPLGIIPCGSGNGLAKSLGINTTEEAMLKIIKGVHHPLDLLKVQQDDKTTYAFLIGNRFIFTHMFSCLRNRQ